MAATGLSKLPRVVLGTMTFGPKGQTLEPAARDFLDRFKGGGFAVLAGDEPELDTAIMYQGGETEKLLGKILSAEAKPFRIATKANAFSADKNLSPSGLRTQLETSLESLQQKSVDIFYLHAPDAGNEIEPTLEEVAKLHKEKKFQRFGLSNFTSWETVYIHGYMEKKGYITPSVYQGMYNGITRDVEDSLFPALRKLGMSFYAYNPLAGGMLSGKYSAAGSGGEANSRFVGEDKWSKIYRDRFQTPKHFAAVEKIRAALEKAEGPSIPMAEASLRWMRHHSKLGGEDAVIIGASKVSHFDSNMTSLMAGPLPANVVAAFAEASAIALDVCPSYQRGYSGSLNAQQHEH